ncbi:MAG: RDD family protein [Proteobacteria bacterium]|nr:MAG: RDD family protein [Pseudomonadota bacterium]
MNRTVQAKPKEGVRIAPAFAPSIPRELSGIKLHHSLDEDFSVYPSANFVERVFALGIDYFVLGIAVTLLESPFGRIVAQLTENSKSPKVTLLSILIWLIALALLQIAPLVFWGQTLGKTFFGLRVVNEDNTKALTSGQVILREIVGKSISALLFGIGFLMMLWNPKRQTFHDKICATKVVKIRR